MSKFRVTIELEVVGKKVKTIIQPEEVKVLDATVEEVCEEAAPCVEVTAAELIIAKVAEPAGEETPVEKAPCEEAPAEETTPCKEGAVPTVE